MSLTVDGFWKSGFWATTFWADGFWREGAYAPVSSGSLDSAGGLISWNPKRIYFSDSDARPIKVTDKEVELIQEAREVIKRANPEELDEVIAISNRLKSEIDSLNAKISEYTEKLENRKFNEFSQKIEIRNTRKELQQLMIDAEIKAEIMRQQVEEIDVVFVLMALLST